MANVVEVENLDASGNLYGFLDSVNVQLGNRRLDDREEGFGAARSSTASANFGQGSTAQLVVTGSTAANTIIGGYDNDSINGAAGNDLLFGGNLKFLVQHASNPNLLSATGGLAFDNPRNTVADDGRDTLEGGAGDDGIIVELDGGRIDGGGDSDTGFLTNFTVGRVNGVTGSNEDKSAAANEAAALDAITTDNVVRIDLGNQNGAVGFTTTGAAFINYGGSNLNGTADQTKYEAGVTAVDIDGLENVIATGLGNLDYDADGGNVGDLSGFGAKYQANFAGFSGALNLRGSSVDNILYANVGSDDIEGREGNDKLSGGRGDDDFIFTSGDGRDLIWRQNDKNSDGIWDGTFGRDFRADPFAAAATVPTTIDFSFTNLAVLDDVGTLTFLRAGTLVSVNVGAANLTTVASLVTAINAAGLPAGVTVAALNANTIRFTDANGLQAVAPGVTSVSGAALPVTLGPIVQGSTTTPDNEDDRIVFASYESRPINSLDQDSKGNLDNFASQFVVSFADQATGDSAVVDSTIARGQTFTITVNTPATGDVFSITLNGQTISVTSTSTSAVTFAGEIVAALSALDANARYGTLTATAVGGGTAGTAQFTLVNDGSVFLSPSGVGIAGNGSASIANNTADEIIVTDFDGRNAGFNAESIVFFGRDAQLADKTFSDSNATSRSTLATAANSGGTLNGKDSIAGGFHGQDLLIGGTGNDTINGLGGNDIIFGSVGTDSVNGGAGTDKLYFDQTLIGDGTKFTLVLPSDALPINNASGTVNVTSSTGAALGSTTFSAIEQVRTFSNTGADTIDAAALSSKIATLTTTRTNNFTAANEGVNATFTAAGAAITYNFDVNDNGTIDAGLTGAADEDNLAVVTAVGFESLTTGNGNDSVTVDASQTNVANTFILGGQGALSTTGEGADSLTYTDTTNVVGLIATITAAGNGTVAAAVGGVVGKTDTFQGVENLNFTGTAATSRGDLLDLVGTSTTGVVVNFSDDVGLTPRTTLGGSLTGTSVAVTEANTLEQGGVSATGNAVGTELIEIGDIERFDRVNTGAGNDTIFVGDTLTDATIVIPAANIGFMSGFGATTVQAVNVNLYTFDLGAGTDTLDYGSETGAITVVLSTAASTPTRVIVDGATQNVLTDAGDRVDNITNNNVEIFVAGQAAGFAAGDKNSIDLTNATVATTTTFSALTGASEPVDPLGNPATAPANALSGITVTDTATPATVYGKFYNRLADPDGGGPIGTGVFDVVSGGAQAETVIFTNAEDAAVHSLFLGTGLNIVDYTRLSDAITVSLNADGTGIGAGANGTLGNSDDTLNFNVTKVGGGATDTVQVIGSGNLKFLGNTDASKRDTVSLADSAGGATVQQFTVNLATGVVTTKYDSNNLLDFVAVDFENVTVADIKASVTGDGEDNVITTAGGNDTIVGAGGSDTITTAGGNDNVDGGDGADTVTAGDGNDTVLGGAGADSITAGEGTDKITGGGGSDTIILTEVTSVADQILYVGTSAGDSSGFNQAIGGTADIVTGFTTGTDRIVLTVQDSSNLVNLAVQLTTGAQDGDADADDATFVADLGSDNAVGGAGAAADTSINLEDIGAVVAGDFTYRVLQSTNGDAQNIGAGNAGRYELVYTAQNQSTLATRDVITGFDFTTDAIDLSAFGFTGTGIASLIIQTPVSVDTSASLTGFFADAGGVNRRIVIQQEGATANYRLFIDINGDGNFTQEADMVIDLVGVVNAGAGNVNITVADFLFA